LKDIGYPVEFQDNHPYLGRHSESEKFRELCTKPEEWEKYLKAVSDGVKADASRLLSVKVFTTDS
jgi:hypothetical protein